MTSRLSYEDSGVNIDTADIAKREMTESLNTSDSRVISENGMFASLFEADFANVKQPVLVLKSEEPGSKQLLSFKYNKVENICYDLINHLINDIIVMGAKPEVVLDVILCGKLEKDVVVKIVKSLSQACKEQGCSLVGGETSEQPKVLQPGMYMLSATILGVVDKERIIDGSKIEIGDKILALPSNGLHTNGYSLVRQLIENQPNIIHEEVGGQKETFLEAILRPHKCYYQEIKDLFEPNSLNGLAHITGGGIQGNLNRILPKHMSARIDLSKIKPLKIFDMIREKGNVEDSEMLRTFNMGVGMVLVANSSEIDRIQEHLINKGCNAYVIGDIVSGNKTVEFNGYIKW